MCWPRVVPTARTPTPHGVSPTLAQWPPTLVQHTQGTTQATEPSSCWVGERRQSDPIPPPHLRLQMSRHLKLSDVMRQHAAVTGSARSPRPSGLGEAIGGDWACDRMVAARVIESADSRTVCVPFRDLLPPHLMRHTSIPGPVPGRAETLTRYEARDAYSRKITVYGVVHNLAANSISRCRKAVTRINQGVRHPPHAFTSHHERGSIPCHIGRVDARTPKVNSCGVYFDCRPPRSVEWQI